MPGLDFLYGGLGAADAITNLVAQRNFQQQQAALQAQKSAQQQFENSLLQSKTDADVLKARADAYKAMNPEPKPAPVHNPIPIRTVDAAGKPITLYKEAADVIDQSFPEQPKESVTLQEPQESVDAKTGAYLGKLVPELDASGKQIQDLYTDNNGHVYHSTEIRKAPVAVDPETRAANEAARAASQQTAQATLGMREDAALTTSYDHARARLDKDAQPIRDHLQKVSDALDLIQNPNQTTDALAIPKVLSSLVGGQGSGLRMTQSEINTIAKSRTVWEGLQTAVSKWGQTGNAALLSPAQRQLIGQLLQASRDKAARQLGQVNKAADDLDNATSSTQHRQILTKLERDMDSQLIGTGTAVRDASGQLVIKGGG